SPDSRRLATVCFNRSGQLWQVDTGRSEAALKGYNGQFLSVAWSPDGKTIATGSTDHSVGLWNPDGTLRQRLPLPDRMSWALTFTRGSCALLLTGDPHYSAVLD